MLVCKEAVISSALISLAIYFLQETVTSTEISREPKYSIPSCSAKVPLKSIDTGTVIFLVVSGLRLIDVATQTQTAANIEIIIKYLSLYMSFLSENFLFLFSAIIFSSSLQGV